MDKNWVIKKLLDKERQPNEDMVKLSQKIIGQIKISKKNKPS